MIRNYSKDNITLKRIGIVACVLLLAVASVIMLKPTDTKACNTTAECQAKIEALESEISSYNQEVDRLNQEAITLESTIAKLNSEAAVMQKQIDILQAKYDSLVLQIAETEAKIQTNKDALGTIIADLYVDDDITPLEMLASSQNISDYMDKQEYRSAVRDDLTSTISDIKALKVQLEGQKDEVEVILVKQKEEKAVLDANRNQQQQLLSQTNGQEAAYQNLISDNYSEIAEAKAIQAAIAARFNGSGGYVIVDSGSLVDYPWNSSNCYVDVYGYSHYGSDGNGGDGHGYGCRQCASYVAWRIAKETGYYYSWGNAIDFYQNALNVGYQAGPAQAGSIAIMTPATAGNGIFGHVAWVEAVNGGQVLISQYNFNYGAGYGMYSQMWLSVNAFDYYIYIGGS